PGAAAAAGRAGVRHAPGVGGKAGRGETGSDRGLARRPGRAGYRPKSLEAASAEGRPGAAAGGVCRELGAATGAGGRRVAGAVRQDHGPTPSAPAQTARTGGGNRMSPVPRPPDLGEDDLVPLLQATASRSLDTCLRGARGLAVLGDPRAFGLLLQLSR